MIPKPARSRFCHRCGHNVLTVKGRHRRDCKHCGAPTSKREPKPLRRGRKTIWAKRAEVKAAGDLTVDQWCLICRFYDFKCAWCEFNRATQQDHVHPIRRGGKHTASNVVPACEGCNSAKGSSKRWVLKRPHPFMVKAQAEARALELAASFDTAGLDMGGAK